MWFWAGKVEATGCNADNDWWSAWNRYTRGAGGAQWCQLFQNSQIWRLQFRHSALGTLVRKAFVWIWYRYDLALLYFIRSTKVSFNFHLLGITLWSLRCLDDTHWCVAIVVVVVVVPSPPYRKLALTKSPDPNWPTRSGIFWKIALARVLDSIQPGVKFRERICPRGFSPCTSSGISNIHLQKCSLYRLTGKLCNYFKEFLNVTVFTLCMKSFYDIRLELWVCVRLCIAANNEQIIAAVRNGERPPLDAISGPADLVSFSTTWIAQCWQQLPDERPSFAGE